MSECVDCGALYETWGQESPRLPYMREIGREGGFFRPLLDYARKDRCNSCGYDAANALVEVGS